MTTDSCSHAIRVVLLAMLLAPAPAIAQTPQPEPPDTGLAGLLPRLILRDIRLPDAGGSFSHAAHFSPLSTGDVENPAVGIVDAFNTLMTLQLSTFPLGSSAGGFAYAFDPGLGTFTRTTSSFGPAFAERATTIGRRRFSTGFTYQHTTYNKFEGLSLDDGSIKFYLRHRDCCTAFPPNFAFVFTPDGTRLNPFFEGDVIEAALSMKVKTDTVVLFSTYGVSDRLDLGVAVPILHVDIDARVHATIQRIATVNTPTLHAFVPLDPAAVSNDFSSKGSATGLGDVLVRAKYRLFDWGEAGGLAAAADVRLPTGDEKDLLGGAAQGKFFVIASRGGERLSQHMNVGYAFSGSVGRGDARLGDLPDEFVYAGGVEYVAHPKLTLVGDLLGRSLPDAGRLEVETKTFQFVQGNVDYIPEGPTMTAQFNEFEPKDGTLNLLFATVGAKYNPFGNFLISGSVLFPLTDNGLRNRLTTTFGIDYTF